MYSYYLHWNSSNKQPVTLTSARYKATYSDEVFYP